LEEKKESNENHHHFHWYKKLGYENIFLNIFKKVEITKIEGKNMILENFNQLDNDDVNLNSFVSNINFIDYLCNICEVMRVTEMENQLKLLQTELHKLNKNLPSNIYIPFLSETIRNYIIVHIPVSETKIFKTKNRAPYMITVELIRIDELIFYLNSKRKKEEKLVRSIQKKGGNENDVRSYSFQEDSFIKKKVNKTEYQKTYTNKKKPSIILMKNLKERN